MKLILIALVVLGLLGGCGWKVFSYFAEKRRIGIEAVHKRDLERLERELEAAKVATVPVVVPGASPGAVDLPAEMLEVPAAGKPLVQTVVGSYRFKNRLVPPAPGFLKDETKVGMVVQTEEASNSWVWIGSAVLASQIDQLAKSYDVEQVEMDLEFVLVLLSTDKLKERGLSLFYDQRANWMTGLALNGDSGSLRITSGGWAVDVAFGDATSGLSLLSQPVIRCLDGEPWKFANDSEVPVPRSEYVDGVLRQSVDFRPIGFGLDGVVRIVGERILLQVEQRNGSITPATAKEGFEVPTFNNQTLQTSLDLAWWEWSVLGGIQIDREQLRKGLFRSSVQASSDYLVIFVRPRLALEAAPQAVPVGSSSTAHPLLDDDGLLPPKGWQEEEAQFIKSHK